MTYANSRSEQNLWAAFNAESAAYVKYKIFADFARGQGYEKIAAVLDETAKNELAHATIWFNELKQPGDVAANLKKALDAEYAEWTHEYPEFERVAREENFAPLADLFARVAGIEQMHQKRFQTLLDQVQEGQVFARSTPQAWHCRHCGYAHMGTEAPKQCPTCKHPQSYFEIMPKES
ncbi:MAG TPA: rubrerythrin family protein [Clostridia bacterium]|nr:rubrerythrin family protein [Clostridia bacterium]